MSTLQSQAIEMIDGLSDTKVAMVISFIKEMPDFDITHKKDKKTKALKDLFSLRDECLQYFGDEFDPKEALVAGLGEKYGRID